MHQVLFVIPIGSGIPVFGYGLFMMLGFVVGLAIACRRADKAGLPKNSAMDTGLIAIFAGVIGARVAFLLIDYQPVEGHDGIATWFAVWNGGLTFQGGLALAMLAAWVYLKCRGIPLGKMFDIFAPALAVGVGFGRLGCLMNGCCWGKPAPASFPWSMTFPHEIESMASQIVSAAHWPVEWAEFASGLGYPAGTGAPLPLYPTQIVSALGLFLIGAGLMLAEKIWRNRANGQTIVWFIFAYSLGRFLIEFWRDDTPLRYGFSIFPGLRLGQWMALAMFAVAVLWQMLLNRRQAAKGKQ